MTNRIGLARAATFFVSLLAAWAVPGASALAQNYPTRPMRWVVPYPPGGATDITVGKVTLE